VRYVVDRQIRKIKLGGFFSPSKTLMYEVTHMHPVSGGDARSITMYSEDGKRIGKMEYERGGRECRIFKITVDDWSTSAYAADFLAYFMKEMKKARVGKVTTEVFDTDVNTHKLLTVFRKAGYSVSNIGNVTGYNQYEVTWGS
jgi:hypothetical protein